MFLWTVYNLRSIKRKIFYSIIFFILNFFTVTYFCYYHFFLLSPLDSNYSWNLTIVCLADWDFFFSRESSSNLKPSLLIMKCLISAKQLFELHNLLFLPVYRWFLWKCLLSSSQPLLNAIYQKIHCTTFLK